MSRPAIQKGTPKRAGKSTSARPASPKPHGKKTAGKEEVLVEENSIKRISENKTMWFRNEKMKSLEGKFDNIDSLSNIVKTAMKGVSPDVFYTFATLIDIPDRYLAELINTSARTLSNYKEQNKALEPVKGEHLLKLIVLFKKGEAIFGNLHEFQGWLFKPQLHAGEVPVDWLVTPGGVDLVSQELDRIAYGYPI